MRLRDLPLHAQLFLRRWSGYRYKVRATGLLSSISPSVTVELFKGVRIDLDLRDATQLATLVEGPRYEEPTPAVLQQWGRAGGSVFLDIGANFGFYSYWMATVCPDVEIYAFEPDERTADVIARTKRRNGLDRITPVQLGLSDRPSRRHLRLGAKDLGHSTFGEHPALEGLSTAPVQLESFDGWRRAVGLELPDAPGWICKIDVEGYEERVLEGMEEALLARAFLGLAVEINEYTLGMCGSSPAAIFRLMKRANYRPLDRESRMGPNAFFVPDDRW